MNEKVNLPDFLIDQSPAEQAYIGELLMAENLISQGQLQEAIDQQNAQGGLLG